MLPAELCSYVFGNPPFVGAKLQSGEQRAQVRSLAALGGSGGTLDYVAAWFIRAGQYAQGGYPRIGFVATNSITQGEQVAQLWPVLFHRSRLEITFAHRTFVWPGRAAVHCVIVGLACAGQEPAEKRLFSYIDGKGEPIETQHDALTAYLFDANSADRHLVVQSTRTPMNGAPAIRYGTQPIDGGHLIFEAPARAEFLRKQPALEPYVRPYVGSEEYINASQRWLLCLGDAPPHVMRVPEVKERLAEVREFRLASKRPATRELATSPTSFHFTTIPEASFLVIPEVSSERREYVPIGWLEPPTVPSNLVRVLPLASFWDFGILTSAMHMSWLRHIGGRLKSDYRYSIGLVYNTFPWPNVTPAQKKKIEALAQAVLDARALPKNATSSLADLYDPDTMPSELRKAHRDLDVAVDKLYRARPFKSDRERVEHIFPLYEALVQPTSAAPKGIERTERRLRRSAKGSADTK